MDSIAIDNDVTNYTLSSLHPATEYEINLNAVSGSQESKSITTSVFTGQYGHHKEQTSISATMPLCPCTFLLVQMYIVLLWYIVLLLISFLYPHSTPHIIPYTTLNVLVPLTPYYLSHNATIESDYVKRPHNLSNVFAPKVNAHIVYILYLWNLCLHILHNSTEQLMQFCFVQ